MKKGLRNRSRQETVREATREINIRHQAVEGLGDAGFDVDAITDIHPKILKVGLAAGAATLRFWQTLAETPAGEEPDYTALLRYDLRLAQGCYGFGQPERFELRTAILRVFEGLTPASVGFVNKREGRRAAFIRHPNNAYVTHGSSGHAAPYIAPLGATNQLGPAFGPDTVVLFDNHLSGGLSGNVPEPHMAYEIHRGRDLQAALSGFDRLATDIPEIGWFALSVSDMLPADSGKDRAQSPQALSYSPA